MERGCLEVVSFPITLSEAYEQLRRSANFVKELSCSSSENITNDYPIVKHTPKYTMGTFYLMKMD